MRKKLILISLFLMIPFFVSAYTKKDILDLTKNVNVCDDETESTYNRYFKIYSRLLNIKDVSEGNINTIYKNLTEALKLIEEENICSLDNLDDLTSAKKNKIYNYLYSSSKILLNSPNIENSEVSLIDTEEYKNGEFIENVAPIKTKFNYVGFNKDFIYLKYILPSSLLFSFIFLLFTRKKKFIANIFIIMFTILLILNVGYFCFGSTIYNLYNIVESLNYKETKNVVKMEVKNKKIIKYPTSNTEFSRLKIASLNIDLPIYYGQSKDILKKGIGFTGSFPGFKGTTILSGHNSKIYLNNLKNIKFDAIITIETNYGIFEYQVDKMEVLGSEDYTLLEKNDKTLIIYTCYPFDELVYSNQRFVIYSSLVKEKWNDD